MAGFHDRGRLRVIEVNGEGVVRVERVSLALKMVPDLLRTPQQGDNLIERMHAKAIKRAVEITAGTGFRRRAKIVKMAFDLDNFPSLPLSIACFMVK